MKELILFGSSVLAASTLLGACSTGDSETYASEAKTVTRTFRIADDTRTVYDEGTIHFGSDESFVPFVWTSDAPAVNLATDESVARRSDGTVEVRHTDASAETYCFGFVSPAACKATFDGNAYTLTLPAMQYPAADGSCFDPAADVLVSKLTTTDAEPVMFRRMFGFLRVTVSKPALDGIGADERVYSVSFETGNDVALTGTAAVPATENFEECKATFVSHSNRVEAVYPEGAEFDASGNLTVWFVVNPVSFEGATVAVETSYRSYKAEYTAEQWSATLVASKVNTVGGLTYDAPTFDKSVYYIDGKPYSTQGATRAAIAADADADVSFLVTGKNGVCLLSNEGSDHVFVGDTRANAAMKDLAIIGTGDSKVSYKMTYPVYLRNPEATVAFKNLNLDFSAITNYVFNLGSSTQTDGGMGSLIFEDCDITLQKPLVTTTNAVPTAGIRNIVIRNCKIHYTGTGALAGMIYVSPAIGAGAEVFESFVFENNILYSTNINMADPRGVAVIEYEQSTSAGTASVAMSNLEVKCNRNSFYNAIGMSKQATLSLAFPVKSVEYTGNVMYTDNTDKTPFVLGVYAEIPESEWPNYNLSKTDNICGRPAKENGNTTSWKLYNTGSGLYYPSSVTNEVFVKKSDIFIDGTDPAAGVFKKNPSYAAYGSTLE